MQIEEKMSRNYAWVYRVQIPRSVEAYDLHCAVFGYQEDDDQNVVRRFRTLLPMKILQGGGYCGTDPAELDVWLWGNRTKVKRLKLVLDRHFGTVGIVTQDKDLWDEEECCGHPVKVVKFVPAPLDDDQESW